jgi:hypothetical protein
VKCYPYPSGVTAKRRQSLGPSGKSSLGVPDVETQGPSLSHPARTNPLGDRQNAVSIVSSSFRGRTRTNLRTTSLRMVGQQASWGSAYAAPIFINLTLAGIYIPVCCWIASHDVRMYACSYEYLRQLHPVSLSSFAAVSLALIGSLFSLFLNRNLRWLVLLELRHESQEFLRQIHERSFSILPCPQELYAWGHGRNRKGNQ